MKVFSKKKEGIEHDINPMLRLRWSPRAFSESVVEEGVLKRLFEAARWAPSSYNAQPWHFIYAHREDEENLQKILDCLSYNNQKWASKAAVLMISVVATKVKVKGEEKNNPHAKHDLGQAIAHMTMQAYFEKLFVHQMAGFNADKAKETFGIEGDYEPVTAIALGYIGPVEDLPDDLEEREFSRQKRKPQEEFAFAGEWKPEG